MLVEAFLIVISVFFATCASFNFNVVAWLVFLMALHDTIFTWYEIWKYEKAKSNKGELALSEGFPTIQPERMDFMMNMMQMTMKKAYPTIEPELMDLILNLMQMTMKKDQQFLSDMQEREARTFEYVFKLIKHTDEERAKAEERHRQTYKETSKLHTDTLLKVEEMRAEERLSYRDTLLAMHGSTTTLKAARDRRERKGRRRLEYNGED